MPRTTQTRHSASGSYPSMKSCAPMTTRERTDRISGVASSTFSGPPLSLTVSAELYLSALIRRADVDEPSRCVWTQTLPSPTPERKSELLQSVPIPYVSLVAIPMVLFTEAIPWGMQDCCPEPN
ncbi:hypothetical protein A0H81_03397 [Grifola frondosa]|uniref:Uncharacterized protein n=1 Tax=Grifola frondosa TaxID=5627 RepID=A0A1C7MHY0_GRIFR|nr:hypothetical protein A0H81_03397 [Grifola frondosa]